MSYTTSRDTILDSPPHMAGFTIFYWNASEQPQLTAPNGAIVKASWLMKAWASRKNQRSG